MKKMPFIQKIAFKSIYPGDIDNKSLDIIYNMAIDEFGYSPDMVNKGNIVKAAASYAIGNNNELFDAVGHNIFISWAFGEDLLNEDQRDNLEYNIIQQANKIDEIYDIYTDEGFEAVKSLVEAGYLNHDKIRELYQTKYKDIYNKERK